MSQPALIIFDCDGVLIDSEAIANKVLVDTLAEFGVHITRQEAIERYMGKSESYEYADIRARRGIELPPTFSERKRQLIEKLYEEELEAMNGISELLKILSVKKCIASSSSPVRLEHCLKLVGLWKHFAPHIFSATQVKYGKPAPDLFLFAAAQMQTNPADCLVIEDSPAGVQAAKAANMRVYGFTGGSHCDATHGERLLREGAEKIFNNMNDLARASLPTAA